MRNDHTDPQDPLAVARGRYAELFGRPFGGGLEQVGNDGDNWLFGSKNGDLLYGANGDDRIAGDRGGDLLLGGDGDDSLFGHAGNDRLSGDDGNDRLYGGRGNDHLEGGAGDDLLDGGSGRDLLDGGTGNDRLTGGAGADVFRWRPDALGGRDTVTDYRPGEDRIDVSAVLAAWGHARPAREALALAELEDGRLRLALIAPDGRVAQEIDFLDHPGLGQNDPSDNERLRRLLGDGAIPSTAALPAP